MALKKHSLANIFIKGCIFSGGGAQYFGRGCVFFTGGHALYSRRRCSFFWRTVCFTFRWAPSGHHDLGGACLDQAAARSLSKAHTTLRKTGAQMQWPQAVATGETGRGARGRLAWGGLASRKCALNGGQAPLRTPEGARCLPSAFKPPLAGPAVGGAAREGGRRAPNGIMPLVV